MADTVSFADWLAAVAAIGSCAAAFLTYKATQKAALAAEKSAEAAGRSADAAGRSADAQHATLTDILESKMPVVEAHEVKWIDADKFDINFIVRNRADEAMVIELIKIAEPENAVVFRPVHTNELWTHQRPAPQVELALGLKPQGVVGRSTTDKQTFPIRVQPAPTWNGGRFRIDLTIRSTGPEGTTKTYLVKREAPPRPQE